MIKCIRYFMIVFVLGALCFNTSSGETFEWKTSKFILDNGMTVVITEMPNSPKVSVFGLVKTGSASEGPYLGSGISHFLEHMLFKGTKNRGVGEIAAQIQAVGGNVNASTGKDHTIYTLTLPYKSFDVALEILADMLQNSAIDSKELEKERSVILSEMKLHRDNPARWLNEMSYTVMYTRHPYRHPIIGYKSLFLQLTQEDLVDYYLTHYIPNNMVLSIAGNIKTNDVIKKVKKTFASFERETELVRVLPKEPQQITPRYYEEEYATPYTFLSFSYPSTSLLDKDLYAMDVLSGILGGGRSSRLYQKLYKEQKLVQSISAHNYTPIDSGAFEINAMLEDSQLEATIDAIREQIEWIKSKGVSQDELDKIKRQTLKGYIDGMQASNQIAYRQAYDEAFAGDYDFSSKYFKAIKAVTAQQIQDAARRYLFPSTENIVVLRPKSDRSSDQPETQISKPEHIERFVLDNGMTLLIREDHSLPIVSIHFVLNGGLRQEPAQLSGISKMLSSVWTKGTKSLTAKDISSFTDSLAISLSSFSGTNSLGLGLSFLSEDTDTTLRLLRDIVLNPSFPQEEIDIVRSDFKTAINTRKDNIGRYAQYEMRRQLFKSHPHRFDTYGTIESLEKIKRKDLISFYDGVLSADSVVMTVFGDVKKEDIFKKVKASFRGLPNKKFEPKKFYEAPLQEMRFEDIALEKEQAIIMFGFHGLTLDNPDKYGLEILMNLIGSAFDGRLFKKVREEIGQAYNMGAASVPSLDLGYLFMYVLTNEASIEQVKSIMKQEVVDIQKNKISEENLINIKTYLKGSFQGQYETNSALSFTSSLDELYHLGYQKYLTYDKNIDAVTVDDVQRLANEYLTLDKMSVLVIKPEAGIE
ncbi:MAG: insulinase family protein [Candidatus Omnitrophica bacterium]|nr:insulinase family protein [Candidatus Omnitrophota bacterium]